MKRIISYFLTITKRALNNASDKKFIWIIILPVASFLVAFFVIYHFLGLEKAKEELFISIISALSAALVTGIFYWFGAAIQIFYEQQEKIDEFEKKPYNPKISFKTLVKNEEKLGHTTNNYAFLEVLNHENLPLLKCIFYLERMFFFPPGSLKPIDVSERLSLPRRLSWRKEDYANNICELNIESGLSKTIQFINPSGKYMKFNFCDGEESRYGLNQIEMKLIGEINGKNFEKKFRGFIFLNTKDEIKEGNITLLYDQDLIFIDEVDLKEDFHDLAEKCFRLSNNKQIAQFINSFISIGLNYKKDYDTK